jgi:hypothetical protein
MTSETTNIDAGASSLRASDDRQKVKFLLPLLIPE